MIRRQFLQEWPLAAFTLAIQVASGIAAATTMPPGPTQSPAQLAALRALGIAVFPIVVAGLLLSLMHLGRPLSAWRALSNCLHSRLSLEVMLTAAFAGSAFAYSFIWWKGSSALRLPAGTTASLFGVAAVVASAAIYERAARRVWNSAWVMTSFIGNTVLVAGLARWMCCRPSSWGIIAILVGSALLLVSGVWMWVRLPRPLEHAELFRTWFALYLLLLIPAPLFLILLPEISWTITGRASTFFLLALGMITGRMLMLALGELERSF